MNKEIVKIAASGISGLLIGGFVGYVVTQRVLSAKYEERIAREVDGVKEYYLERERQLGVELMEDEETRNSEPVTPDDFETLVEKGKNTQLMQELGYSNSTDIPRHEEEETPESVDTEEAPRPSEFIPDASEVREESEDDYRVMTIEEETPIDEEDEELQHYRANRNTNEPYVITVDEFMTTGPDYVKVTATFFEGDDTLMEDDRERVLHDSNSLVGTEFSAMFGKWSKDKDHVYVRNERQKLDFEIVRDDRDYVTAVAGLNEPKESKVRKMRRDIE